MIRFDKKRSREKSHKMTSEIPLLLQILEILHYDNFLPAHSKPTLELSTFVPCIGKGPSCSLPQRQQMLP